MDGLAFVQMVEAELKRRDIPKERFYKESGISSATMSQWRKRIYSPSSAAIKKIEEYLGVTFTIEQKEKAPANDGKRDSEGCNILKIAGRDGSFRERVLSDQQLAALIAIVDQMPDVPEDL